MLKSESVPTVYPFIQDFGKQPFKLLEESNTDFTNFVDLEISAETYSVFYQLGDLGFMVFHAKRAWDRSQKRQFKQLKDVLNKFAVSIRASLAYQKSILETEKNQALAKIAAERERAIKAMSTPIAQLWQNILLLPLVGSLDAERSLNILTTILEKISTTQSKIFILDISGIINVDEFAVQQLVKIAKSTRLIGCQCILSGISGEIAQHIVELDINIQMLKTTSTMKDALDMAFRSMGTYLSKKK